MEKNDVIRVAIIDDSRSTIQSIKEFLNYSRETTVVLTASGGLEFLKKMKSLHYRDFPDVVLTDINMPDMNGIETVRHGKLQYPNLKFLMLTVYDDDDLLFDAIKAGASGYLLKDEKISVIVEHIQQLVFEGGAPMSPRIARKTLQMLMKVPSSDSSKSESNQYQLSIREKEVLQFLVDGLDYRNIARELNLSPNTIRKHIANIYEKLHVNSKAQAIKLVNDRNILE